MAGLLTNPMPVDLRAAALSWSAAPSDVDSIDEGREQEGSDTYAPAASMERAVFASDTRAHGLTLLASDNAAVANHSTVSGYDVGLMVFIVASVAGGFYALRRYCRNLTNGGSIADMELGQRIEQISVQRSTAWTRFYTKYYGSSPPDSGETEVRARSVYRALPIALQWSLAMREGLSGALDIERHRPDADRLLPPVTLAEYCVRVFHSAQQDDIAAREVLKLDRTAAIHDIENYADELDRYARVFQELKRRLSANGREIFGIERPGGLPTFETDVSEIHQRSHQIALTYGRVIDNLDEQRRVGLKDRVLALMLSIKATHLILRAIQPDEIDEFTNSAVRAWKRLPKTEREGFFVLDMMMGMRGIREREKNPAPFAVTWCFMWAWPKFSPILKAPPSS
ncbi:MAG: hypothetical protein WC956_09855 [bacterium]